MNRGIYTGLRKAYPRTWRIWYRMNRRCKLNEKNYVEVEVADEWNYYESGEQGFINFFDEMGPCENPELSIDRINVFGHYEPGNCRWVDNITQSNNTRFHTTHPRGKMVKQAVANGISRSTFYQRCRSGWNHKDAATIKPYVGNRYKDHLCE